MPMQGAFDATQYAPRQAGTTHPTGKYSANVVNTTIEPTKDGSGGMFIVEYRTEAGSIAQRFNLWNQSDKAVAIAQGQLSALCHATGVFKLDWQNDGAALRNAQLMIEVTEQIDKETKQPNGYTQVQKVYDRNGNEPGKPPQQPTTAPQQPSGQAPAHNWGSNAQAPTANPQPSPSPAWGNALATAQAQPNPAWQAGPSVAASPNLGTNPPWANKT